MVKIIELDPQDEAHKLAFKQINYEWIEKYFKVEKGDIDSLENPEKYFLNHGGVILLAQNDGKFIGTSALKTIENQSFELCKMGVAENSRGIGIGYIIGEAALTKAKELGAKRVYLETNSSLLSAISLYKKLGFIQLKNFSTPYARADVAMEIWLE